MWNQSYERGGVHRRECLGGGVWIDLHRLACIGFLFRFWSLFFSSLRLMSSCSLPSNVIALRWRPLGWVSRGLGGY